MKSAGPHSDAGVVELAVVDVVVAARVVVVVAARLVVVVVVAAVVLCAGNRKRYGCGTESRPQNILNDWPDVTGE